MNFTISAQPQACSLSATSPRPAVAAAAAAAPASLPDLSTDVFSLRSGTSMCPSPRADSALLKKIRQQEETRADAKDLLESAAENQHSVLQELNLWRPVQDEMPQMFNGEADRDRYFQSRLDNRAEMVQALQALQSEPGYSGSKTDWSNEKRVDIQSLSPAEKQAFYGHLETLNQAYCGKAIALLS